MDAISFGHRFESGNLAVARFEAAELRSGKVMRLCEPVEGRGLREFLSWLEGLVREAAEYSKRRISFCIEFPAGHLAWRCFPGQSPKLIARRR